MIGRCKARVLAGAVTAVLLFGGAAAAQAPAPAPDKEVEAEAERYFRKGEEHFDKGEYREAYEQYRKSLATKKKRAVLAQAASSLKQLGRYDEALDLLEELRREFPSLPPRLEAKVAPLMKEVQGLVGTLVLAGDVPDGASLFVDDRLRGRLPLAAPLRVSTGAHAIRVEKEGFAPITAAVEVSAGRESAVTIQAPVSKGRLEVRERHNWPLSVEIDGKDVGVTPWDGLVDTGARRVRLHGFVGADALLTCDVPGVKQGQKAETTRDGTKMESALETVSIGLYQVTQIVLGAEDQDTTLKVESTPRNAVVMIDDGQVGLTPWEGRVALGEHKLEVTANGFLPSKQTVRLVRRSPREVSVALVPEPKPPQESFWTPRTIGAGVGYGVSALGLSVFAVTGALALDESTKIKAACPDNVCPGSRGALLEETRTLATVSTVGLVAGAIGAAAGTVVLIVVKPKGKERPAAGGVAAWRAGVGPGRLEIEGRF